MSSPHFNSITAIGCFLCYVHVLLAVFGNSVVYAGGSSGICVVSGNNNLSYHCCTVQRTQLAGAGGKLKKNSRRG